MARQLQITKKLFITPLLNIQSATFAESYACGCYWRLFGCWLHKEIKSKGLLPDSYLVNNLKTSAKFKYLDGYHDEQLRMDVGFFIGMLQGGVLTPNGLLRPDTNTLVTIENPDFREGYERGRHDFFTHESTFQTDNDLLELLKWHIEDNLYAANQVGTLNWAIGCVVGELSGRLFPQIQKGLKQDADMTNDVILQRA